MRGVESEVRRPAEEAMIRRAQMRHLKNRRDTLVIGILAAERSGDIDRVNIIREEANKVNKMISEL